MTGANQIVGSTHPRRCPAELDYDGPTTPTKMATASVERMASLAAQISEKTKIITDYLTAKGLEAASFDAGGLAEFPIPSQDEVPFKARLELVALTQELHDIALTPKEGLRYLAWDVSLTL